MHYTLISPRLAVQKGDFLGSGVPYWPLELAVAGGFLQSLGHTVSVIDLFGLSPGTLEAKDDHYLQGRSISSVLDSPQLAAADTFLLYAISYMSHQELLLIAQKLRSYYPKTPIAVLENSQAVTAYALPALQQDFFAAGVDLLLCGDIYWNWSEIEAAIFGDSSVAVPNNILRRAPQLQKPEPLKIERRLEKHGSFALPCWELFPLQNYWNLPYSHGPKSARRYLPILTSRGCPYPCDFCVVPETNLRRWRGRDPEEVVCEILYLRDYFEVRHFQVEDLNPTVQQQRWERICQLLIEQQAGIEFAFVSGTKVETIDPKKIPLFAQAGCRYISISPESGSTAVLRQIGKPFDFEHALEVVRSCQQQGIYTQACFLVGHPAERPEDHRDSCHYLRQLIRAGLDEVAVFVVSSFAGSALHQQQAIEYNSRKALPSFSPKGRSNWAELASRRRELIGIFLAEKLKQGFRLWLQGLRSILGWPRTKLENLPRRMMFIYSRILASALVPKSGTAQFESALSSNGSGQSPQQAPEILLNKSILLVIPCYNEVQTIAALLQEISQISPRLKTVVVDDGSSDGTFEVASKLSPCLRLALNLGIGGAVQAGIKYAWKEGYDFVVQLDGDGQHPPREVFALLRHYAQSADNLVIGSRFMRPAGYQSSRLRRMGIGLICKVMKLLFGCKLTDPTSGLRLLDRKAMEVFIDSYPDDFPEPISVAYLLEKGLKVSETPVCMRERLAGASSIYGLRNFSYMVRVIGYLFLIRASRGSENR